MKLNLSHEAVGQLLEGKEEAEEKTEKVIADLERKCIFCRILSCIIRSMLRILLLLCYRVLLLGAHAIQDLRIIGEGPG